MTSPTWPDKRRRASNGRRARLSRWFAIAGAIATAGTGATVAASAAGPTAQSQLRPHISGSWMLQNPGTTVALQGAAFVSPTEGYVVGAGGTVLRTVDGGANWNQVASGTLTELHAVTAVPTPGCSAGSGTCVWVAGLAGTVRFSSDAGGTWCTQAAPTSSYNAIGNNGPNDIFIAGSHGTIARGGGAGCGGSYTKYSGTASTDDLDGLAVTTAGALSDGHLEIGRAH